MYEKDGIELTEQDVALNAQMVGMSPGDWATQNGFTLIEGKTTVPGITTPPTGPGKQTPAGESRLGITLLE